MSFLSKIPSSLLYINSAFIASRLVFYFCGIRYDISRIASLHQIIEPALLQDRLFESVFYLHNQPPLLNLLLGTALKIAPNHLPLVLGFGYFLLGLILVNAMGILLQKMGGSDLVNPRVVSLFAIGPACVLYENWLFYTYPITCLLLLAGLCLFHYSHTANRISGFTFFFLLALIAWFQGLFHLVWFLSILGMVVYFHRQKWREILLLALFPFLLILSLYCKNGIVFEVWGASSSFGMHLSKVAIQELSLEKRQALLDSGKISPMSTLYPFEYLDLYEPWIGQVSLTHKAILDNPLKTTGEANLNHIAYIAVSRRYLQDSLAAIRAYPLDYGKQIFRNLYDYFRPSDNYHFIHRNRMKIIAYATLYNGIVTGNILSENATIPQGIPGLERILCPFQTGIFTILLYLLLFFHFTKQLLTANRNDRDRNPYFITVAYFLFNMAFVTILCNLVECGENQRYRFFVEPMMFVLLGILLSRLKTSSNRLRQFLHPERVSPPDRLAPR